MEQYTIRGGEEGRKRLQIISRILQPTTLNLLQRAGIREGMDCLDVGCGGGDVTLEMAGLVGPEGNVVGIDMDDMKLRLAQQDAEQRRLRNVTFRSGDARQLEEESSYDVVYARALLTHLSSPGTVVEKMFRAARQGGAVVVEDVDLSGQFCYPKCRAFERYVELNREVMRRRGGDPDIGPKLPALLLSAALQDVQIGLVQPVFMKGQDKLIFQVTMEAISDAVIAEGLASKAEINSIIDELDNFARNAQTVMGTPRIFQTWGYHK
jgi:ubiquinone/menaquinone biosynthesis C-methylase UbiE